MTHRVLSTYYISFHSHTFFTKSVRPRSWRVCLLSFHIRFSTTRCVAMPACYQFDRIGYRHKEEKKVFKWFSKKKKKKDIILELHQCLAPTTHHHLSFDAISPTNKHFYNFKTIHRDTSNKQVKTTNQCVLNRIGQCVSQMQRSRHIWWWNNNDVFRTSIRLCCRREISLFSFFKKN